jgi:hypothetical protein
MGRSHTSRQAEKTADTQYHGLKKPYDPKAIVTEIRALSMTLKMLDCVQSFLSS